MFWYSYASTFLCFHSPTLLHIHIHIYIHLHVYVLPCVYPCMCVHNSSALLRILSKLGPNLLQHRSGHPPTPLRNHAPEQESEPPPGLLRTCVNKAHIDSIIAPILLQSCHEHARLLHDDTPKLDRRVSNDSPGLLRCCSHDTSNLPQPRCSSLASTWLRVCSKLSRRYPEHAPT